MLTLRFEKMQLISNILLILIAELSCLCYCFPTQNEKVKDAASDIAAAANIIWLESEKNDTLEGGSDDYSFHKANHFTGEESADETILHLGETQRKNAKTLKPTADEHPDERRITAIKSNETEGFNRALPETAREYVTPKEIVP